eukprot:COSAG06_NODE_3099_length_5861_cov_5.328879_1_plen_91_part_00
MHIWGVESLISIERVCSGALVYTVLCCVFYQSISIMINNDHAQGEYSCIIAASKTPGQLLSPPTTIHITTTEQEAILQNKPWTDAQRRYF